MNLKLHRSYFPEGTNGKLYHASHLICLTIELPWKDNTARVSCIPEGKYELARRYSPKFKNHLMLKGVEGRALILIHPANDALQELNGCIAPVSNLAGPGKGDESKKATLKLYNLVCASLAKNESVFITIQSKPDEINHEKG